MVKFIHTAMSCGKEMEVRGLDGSIDAEYLRYRSLAIWAALEAVEKGAAAGEEGPTDFLA
jgi:hypothetical protein